MLMSEIMRSPLVPLRGCGLVSELPLALFPLEVEAEGGAWWLTVPAKAVH